MQARNYTQKVKRCNRCTCDESLNIQQLTDDSVSYCMKSQSHLTITLEPSHYLEIYKFTSLGLVGYVQT